MFEIYYAYEPKNLLEVEGASRSSKLGDVVATFKVWDHEAISYLFGHPDENSLAVREVKE